MMVCQKLVPDMRIKNIEKLQLRNFIKERLVLEVKKQTIHKKLQPLFHPTLTIFNTLNTCFF